MTKQYFEQLMEQVTYLTESLNTIKNLTVKYSVHQCARKCIEESQQLKFRLQLGLQSSKDD